MSKLIEEQLKKLKIELNRLKSSSSSDSGGGGIPTNLLEVIEDLQTQIDNLIPAGGLTGQALVKASDADFDMKWATISGGGSDLANVFVEDINNINGVGFTNLETVISLEEEE